MNTILMILAGTASLVSGDVVLPGTPEPGADGGAPAAAAPPAPGAPSAAAATELVASRLVAGPIDPQIALLRSRLAINSSEVGPFGFFQDPKKAEKQIINIPTGPREAPAETPFDQVVSSIPISIVNPAEQQFVVEGRIITTGDEFPIQLSGQSIPVRVERVRLKAVTFRNLKTGKIAQKAVDLKLEGVTPSNGGSIDIVGVTRKKDSRKAPLPLDLQPPNPTTIGGSR